MPFRLTCVSLVYAFMLVFGATLLGMAFDDTLVGYVGFLLTPGIWAVYDMFDVDNHDVLPLFAAQLINLLVYWALLALLLGLSSKGGRGRAEKATQPGIRSTIGS